MLICNKSLWITNIQLFVHPWVQRYPGWHCLCGRWLHAWPQKTRCALWIQFTATWKTWNIWDCNGLCDIIDILCLFFSRFLTLWLNVHLCSLLHLHLYPINYTLKLKTWAKSKGIGLSFFGRTWALCWMFLPASGSLPGGFGNIWTGVLAAHLILLRLGVLNWVEIKVYL